ncbi:hypothetical protein SM39_1514 [Serratia marcescens SM39]|uniref:Transposase n=1 Tax=Serratia marcescens SM39 TaxID=1334564 RepID=A0AAT9F2K6_SERMA|nr:hypothetical protein SM39_1514 [Serratia marcescens SM39]
MGAAQPDRDITALSIACGRLAPAAKDRAYDGQSPMRLKRRRGTQHRTPSINLFNYLALSLSSHRPLCPCGARLALNNPMEYATKNPLPVK